VHNRTIGQSGLMWPSSVALLVLAAAIPAGAAGPETFTFNAEQADEGQTLYRSQCAACHGAQLEDGSSAPLKGGAFLSAWASGGKTLGDLAHAIRDMPKQAPGSLSPEEYGSLTGYILSANGADADAQIRMDADLKTLLGTGGTARSAAVTRKVPAVFPASPAIVKAAQSSAPGDDELLHPSPDNWLMFNRTYSGDRFSPLSQIDTDNVKDLQAVCIMSPGVLGSFQNSPIIYNGMGFIGSTYGVFAFDPATCERKWEYTHAASGPEGIKTNRGMAIYDGKLFRGTTDGHLLALDMKTGELLWDAHVADGAYGYSIGAAPVAFEGRIIVGLAGGDFGNTGHVYAFDADSGECIWTFDTIDEKSWPKGAERGGGATWTTVAIDVKDRLVFVPVGNPAPDLFPGARPGDNLYTNSVVAIHADTGKIAWHVQQIAGDYHDWDTAAAPVLYEQGGKRMLAVGTKAGYVYIYDRDTRKLVARTSVVPRLNDTLPFPEEPLHVCPGTVAGVEWNGPAFDPASGSLLVNTVDWCSYYAARPPQGWTKGQWYMEGDVAYAPDEERKGLTHALDGVTGKVIWKRKAPAPMIGAVTPTAGGITFTGGADGVFLALDTKSGEELYRFQTGGAIGGGIATYVIDDRQYVAVASGGIGLVDYGIHGAPAVIVFTLPPPR